jgi:hypothetical protein
MAGTTPTDRIRARTVGNCVRMIHEHLEAMQRDAHGLEYAPWKREVDALWKRVFEQINRMAPSVQQGTLESIRDSWTTYITHYDVIR